MKQIIKKMTSCVLTAVCVLVITIIYGNTNASANVKEINKKMIIGQRYKINTEKKR